MNARIVKGKFYEESTAKHIFGFSVMGWGSSFDFYSYE